MNFKRLLIRSWKQKMTSKHKLLSSTLCIGQYRENRNVLMSELEQCRRHFFSCKVFPLFSFFFSPFLSALPSQFIYTYPYLLLLLLFITTTLILVHNDSNESSIALLGWSNPLTLLLDCCLVKIPATRSPPKIELWNPYWWYEILILASSRVSSFKDRLNST